MAHPQKIWVIQRRIGCLVPNTTAFSARERLVEFLESVRAPSRFVVFEVEEAGPSGEAVMWPSGRKFLNGEPPLRVPDSCMSDD